MASREKNRKSHEKRSKLSTDRRGGLLFKVGRPWYKTSRSLGVGDRLTDTPESVIAEPLPHSLTLPGEDVLRKVLEVLLSVEGTESCSRHYGGRREHRKR